MFQLNEACFPQSHFLSMGQLRIATDDNSLAVAVFHKAGNDQFKVFLAELDPGDLRFCRQFS
jgi:protease II